MIKLRWPLLATAGLLLAGAAPTPGPGVPTSTGTLQGTFPFYWDGSAFQPQGNSSAITVGTAGTPSTAVVSVQGITGGTTVPVTNLPSTSATYGITPVVSASLENSHILDASPGNLYSVYASNLTGGAAGNLQIFNATSAPVDGAVTPIVCVPFNSNGVALANYLNGPPAVFATGITAVISSATSCFTKTTGVLTGFISGMVK